MAALSSTSSSLRYSLQGTIDPDAQLNQILEVRLNYVSRLVLRSPSAGLPPQILQQTPATPMACAIFPLHLSQLEDSLLSHLYVVRLLSSLNLRATTCYSLARKITSFATELTGGNHEVNFHIVANIDYIRIFWINHIPGIYPVPMTQEENSSHTAAVEETLILELSQDEAAPTSRGALKSAIERLRKEKFEWLGEEVGECSVCYDELKGGKAVIRMPCGHVYHESCILRWLMKNNSCPLCRTQLQE